MTIKRMDNVLIVVDDLEAAIAFFVELGLELEGRVPIEGPWVDRVIAIDDTRAEIATLRTPDGHGRVELDKFHSPAAVTAAMTSLSALVRRASASASALRALCTAGPSPPRSATSAASTSRREPAYDPCRAVSTDFELA